MKLLTLARDLQRRKSRERHGLFVAEGVRAVEELLRSALEVRGALVSEAFGASDRARALRATLERRAIEVLEVSPRDFDGAASTDTPQGILAIGVVPARRLDDLALPSRARILVLDAVQDPGNVGTLLRTAAALGTAATLALPGTVDLWNGKVVRSAMGAIFHHPALSCTWGELDEFLRDREIPLWGATGDGEPAPRLAAPESLALAVGNEGAGLTAEALARTARRVSIPIEPDIESLNVAVAAGILLYQFRH
ncbi:MAG TPA: RNA methyltransferase [Gemmatimonadaceae bacterium]